MPNYDATPTLSQTIQAALNYSGTMVGLTVDAVKEKARSDLLYMQAQYEADQNDFLLDLQNRSDYNNFEKYIDDFENRTIKKLSDKNSNYYCDNPFTQKKANEMFASQKVALRNKVNIVINQRATQDIMATDRETMKNNRKNLAPQQALDANATLYANWFSHGYIDKGTYNNLLLEEQSVCYQQGVDNFYQKYYQTAINDGLSAEQFWKVFEDNDTELKNLEVRYIPTDLASPENMETGANLTTIKLSPDSEAAKTTKKMFMQNYKAEVSTMQDQNAQQLSQMYSNLSLKQDPNQKLNYCRTALTLINGQMQGQRLDESRRNMYVKLFQAEIDDINRGNKSGSKSNLDKYSEIIKGDEDTYFAFIEEGKMNYQDAAEAYQNHLRDVWESTAGLWKETENMDANEAEKYFMNKYGKAGVDKILNNDVLTNALKRPEYKGIAVKWDSLSKEIAADLKKPEKDRKFSENAMNIAGQFIVSFIAQNGTGVLSKEALEEYDQFLNNLYLDQLDKNFADYGMARDEDIVKGINILMNNDVVMRDVQGNEVWASPQAKEKVDAIGKQQQEIIAKSIDATAADLEPHGYLKTDYDVKPIPVFKYKNDLYHLELTPDGKSYDIVDQNGNRYTALTVEEERYSYKKDKAEKSKEKKEKNTASSAYAIKKGEELDEKTKSYFTPAQQKRLR